MKAVDRRLFDFDWTCSKLGLTSPGFIDLYTVRDQGKI